ncbi:hypothetical protein F7R06_13110 [Pseudomonas moorei]|nr:hypothetical protein F7R06_13110 [Pseudomonas moorei]
MRLETAVYAACARMRRIEWACRLGVQTQCVTASQNECGSELARDGGATVNGDVECDALIANKLAPTGY